MSLRVALLLGLCLAAGPSLAQQPAWPSHPSADRAQRLSALLQESLARQEFGRVVAAATELSEICAEELPDAPGYQAMAENYRGIGLAWLGEHQDALEAFTRSADLYEAALPPGSPHLQTAFDSARQAAFAAGQFDVAWRYEEKTNRLFEASAVDEVYDARLQESAQLWGTARQADTALVLARRRVARMTDRHGEGSPEQVEAVRFVAFVAQSVDAFTLAVEELAAVLPRARALRAEHPELCASVLNELAQALSELARWSEAAPLFDEAFVGLSNSDREMFDMLATLHNNRGLNRKALGDYEGASDDFTRAVFYRRQLDDGPRLGFPLNNRGNLYRTMGLLHAAARDLEEALALRQTHDGPTASTTATTLLNLGLVATQRGDMAEAERQLTEAVEAYRASLGSTHPRTAHAEVTLAQVVSVGRGASSAEPIYARARPTLLSLPPGHAFRQAFLHNDVEAKAASGDLEGAMASALEIERDYAAAGLTASVDYASTLILLADLDDRMGNRARARSRASQAAALLRKSGGVIAGYQIDLDQLRARWAWDANDLDKAARYLQHARGVMAGVEGFHGRSISVLSSQVVVAWAREDRALALETLRELKRFTDAWLQDWLLAGVLDDRAELAKAYEELVEQASTFAILSRDDPDMMRSFARLLVEVHAAHRGLAVAASVQRFQALRRSPQAREKLTALATLRQRLSAVSLGTADDERRAQLQQQVTAAERELSLLQGSSEGFTHLAPSFDELKDALPPGAAYVGYSGGLNAQGEPTMFALAFNGAGNVRVVELAPIAAVQAEVTLLRKLMIGAARQLPELKAVASRLYGTLIGPVRSLAAGDTLVLSPLGPLHLLPWGALVDEDGRWLAETTTVVTMLGPRGLLAPPAASGGRPLVVASPAFGAPGPERLRQWAPLPATEPEASAVAGLLGDAELLLGPDAHEGRLLSARSPRVLHIATHGYFFEAPVPASAADGADPDEGRVLLASARGFRLKGPKVSRPTTGGPASVADAPSRPVLEGDAMVRSGLALAGANSGAAVGDGLLSGLEASSLDLSGTELVVLSACETGMGDTDDGGALGVAGLQRAFAIAGARSQVTSLWSVDDRATRDLMIAFYEHLIQQGLPRGEALRQAQLKVMRANGHSHPYYWAAFVLSGDTRPLATPPP